MKEKARHQNKDAEFEFCWLKRASTPAVPKYARPPGQTTLGPLEADTRKHQPGSGNTSLQRLLLRSIEDCKQMFRSLLDESIIVVIVLRKGKLTGGIR